MRFLDGRLLEVESEPKAPPRALIRSGLETGELDRTHGRELAFEHHAELAFSRGARRFEVGHERGELREALGVELDELTGRVHALVVRSVELEDRKSVV